MSDKASTPESFQRPKFSAYSHADPFAIIEVSLTAIKYTLYHVVGFNVLHHVCPYNPPTTSLLTSAASGFIGGALFTLPFLASLGWKSDATCVKSTDTFLCQLSLLGAEFLYSMIGGAAGMLALGDWSYIGICMGMFRGLVGPLTVFTVLYLLLTITLAIISFTF